MIASPNVIKLAALNVLCVTASVGCGGQGMMPTQNEQSQIESASVNTTATQSFGQSTYGHRFGRLLQGVNLSAAQQTKLTQLVQQFRQTHPPGSAFDPQALRALHQQMLAVLTPQQTQVQQNLEQLHNSMHAIALTDQQRAQIRQLVQQYRQAHPPGSAPDPQARAQLHEQIRNLLTPGQQAQLKQRFEQWPMGRFARLNLSDQQRTQMRQLMEQYRQAHPWGSAPDPQAREQLHQQILNVLTPQQRAQLEQNATSPSSP